MKRKGRRGKKKKKKKKELIAAINSSSYLFNAIAMNVEDTWKNKQWKFYRFNGFDSWLALTGSDYTKWRKSVDQLKLYKICK